MCRMVRRGGLSLAATAVVPAVWNVTRKAGDGDMWHFCYAGDIFRWRDVWPQIADWFGLKAGLPLQARCSFQLA